MKLPSSTAIPPIRIAVLGCGDHAAWALTRIKEGTGFCALLTESALDQRWSKHTTGACEAARRSACPSMAVSAAQDGIEFLKQNQINFIILAGTRWILPASFVSAFNGQIINLHPSRLPQHRGAGVFSWQILNNVREASLSAYWVEEGIDDGPLLFQLRDDEARGLDTPIGFQESHRRLFVKAIDKLLYLALSGELIKITPLTPQKQEESSYFPLLQSAVNGAIDWRWSLTDIDSFIRAFGPPYPGAFSLFNGSRFHIARAHALPGTSMHPFCHGLVIRHTPPGHAHIACNGGVLAIEQIAVDGVVAQASQFLNLGGRVWTPATILDEARTFRASNRDT